MTSDDGSPTPADLEDVVDEDAMDEDVMDNNPEPNDDSDSDESFHAPTEIDGDSEGVDGTSTTTSDSDHVHRKPKPKRYSLEKKVTAGSYNDIAGTNMGSLECEGETKFEI